MEQHISAGVIVYTDQIHTSAPEYLVIKHADGHWDLPKGHVEAGETHKQAALRELHEETGLTAIIDPYFSKRTEYDFITREKKQAHKEVFWFLGKATSRTVLLSHEHTEYAWLGYQRAIQQITHENTKMVLQAAQAHLVHV